jgi:hypothetical protein
MSAESLQTETTYDFKLSSESLIWYVSEQDPRALSEQEFIETCLSTPPTETVEDVSAVAHETNRIPDPRILIIREGKILRLDGIEADKSIEKESYLGKLEYSAFSEIKDWANTVNYGVSAWFSAPFPEDIPPEKRFYPVSKIDIGAIRYSPNNEKILLKRAILLDIDSETLLSIFNNFADKINSQKLDIYEKMRSSPVFFDEDQLSLLLEEIAIYTNQVQQVENGEDLRIKMKNYSKLETIYKEIQSSPNYSHNREYIDLRRRAEEENMIGEKSESCPSMKSESNSNNRNPGIEGGKYVKNCGKCGTLINAFISAGYVCPNCNGVYKGC